MHVHFDLAIIEHPVLVRGVAILDCFALLYILCMLSLERQTGVCGK